MLYDHRVKKVFEHNTQTRQVLLRVAPFFPGQVKKGNQRFLIRMFYEQTQQKNQRMDEISGLKGTTMLATLQRPDVVPPSFGWLSVNNNRYSENLFSHGEIFTGVFLKTLYPPGTKLVSGCMDLLRGTTSSSATAAFNLWHQARTTVVKMWQYWRQEKCAVSKPDSEGLNAGAVRAIRIAGPIWPSHETSRESETAEPGDQDLPDNSGKHLDKRRSVPAVTSF